MLKPTLLAPLVIAWFTLSPPAKEQPVDDFNLQGSASIEGDCIRLTPDAPWARGAAWAKKTVDLGQDFEVDLNLSFGHRDALGADGIVFVLTTQPRLGWRGEGMGFAGQRASLGIEFDTYQNYRENDPAADHLALVTFGTVYHPEGEDPAWNLPASGIVELPNLEDGRRHPARIRWSAKADVLEVHVDGRLRATYPGALVRKVFGDQKVVSWGLTAATGRKTNAHDVCFEAP
ncbi:MAG: L-type lectin-domain containing protein [Myxococcota bacterium]